MQVKRDLETNRETAAGEGHIPVFERQADCRGVKGKAARMLAVGSQSREPLTGSRIQSNGFQYSPSPGRVREYFREWPAKCKARAKVSTWDDSLLMSAWHWPLESVKLLPTGPHFSVEG